jgi:hypothetical protein
MKGEKKKEKNVLKGSSLVFLLRQGSPTPSAL